VGREEKSYLFILFFFLFYGMLFFFEKIVSRF
jgi:hypothetical protein